jgi:hypothetical protein
MLGANSSTGSDDHSFTDIADKMSEASDAETWLSEPVVAEPYAAGVPASSKSASSDRDVSDGQVGKGNRGCRINEP